MSLDSRSDELDKKLENNDIDKSVATLIKGAHRQRRAIRLLAVSIVLDFILTIGLTVVSVKTNEVARLAQSNKEAVIANCETANESRANQLKLWQYVFDIPPTVPRTPEQDKRVGEFKVFIDKTFAQRNCHAEANTK